MSHFIFYYVECHYAECRYDECRYDEGRYAECRFAECRGALYNITLDYPLTLDLDRNICFYKTL